MHKKIAIIGAGPMGLAVAYQLIKEGCKPIIFEADDRIGGMAAMFDFGGVEIERYYHFHCTSDDDFLKVLKELDLEDKLHWKCTKMGYWYNSKLQEWGNPLALLKFEGLSMIAKFRYGLHAFLATKRDNWKPLEKYDAVTWIKTWVGKEAYAVLWSKLFAQKFYEYTDNLSAPWIWSRIRRIGRSRYNLFSEKLGYLSGGSGTYMNAMKIYIEQYGGTFKLNSAVSKIVIKNGVTKGLIVKDEYLEFDTVISTIPLPLVAKIARDLPSDILDMFQSKINIAGVCVIVKLDKPLTENFWLNTNDESMDIPGIIEYSNLNAEVGHIVYVPYYMPQSNLMYKEKDEVYIEKVYQYFKTINPRISDENILEVCVHRYHYAQPICPPNYLKTLPDAKLPIEGLWVADTSYYYPEDRGISESIGYGRSLAKRVVDD
ncbi:MAG TPA: NAD(P)/FAD-dependent oxidoreductase [Arcobacter sp.]|nr:NAD(P)/FAD-dependent oxidoreductase [Arcobacter sp.]